jgi:hypothetical protein
LIGTKRIYRGKSFFFFVIFPFVREKGEGFERISKEGKRSGSGGEEEKEKGGEQEILQSENEVQIIRRFEW